MQELIARSHSRHGPAVPITLSRRARCVPCLAAEISLTVRR